MFCILCVMGVAQCGDKKSKSKDVKLEFLPDDPVVINADLVLYPDQDNEQDIKAPWFLFSTKVTNNSDSELHLISYSFKISNKKNNATVTSTASIDPSITCTTTGFSRVSLATIPSGSEYSDLTDYCDETSVTSASSENWYIDSLPNADNFFYTVEVTGEGWFADSNGDAIERLIMTGQMFTK